MYICIKYLKFRELGIKKESDLYVYEICKNLEDCRQLFSSNLDFKNQDLVDVYDESEKKWKAGIIKGSTYIQENGKLVFMYNVNVEEAATKQIKTLQVSRKAGSIAEYNTRNGPSQEVLHLPLYNRYIKSNGEIAYLEFPKLLAFGSWCSCRQIIGEVLMQAKHFVAAYGILMN